METIKKRVTIPDTHHIELEVPDTIPPGEAEVCVVIQPATGKAQQRTFGSAQGKIWMSDDFDEPLEDFNEHME